MDEENERVRKRRKCRRMGALNKRKGKQINIDRQTDIRHMDGRKLILDIYFMDSLMSSFSL